jgi:hypothetical protein
LPERLLPPAALAVEAQDLRQHPEIAIPTPETPLAAMTHAAKTWLKENPSTGVATGADASAQISAGAVH